MSEAYKNSGQQRRPYEPPKVIAVNLRPEEAVLGHCKIASGGGPGPGGCGKKGLRCKTLGS